MNRLDLCDATPTLRVERNESGEVALEVNAGDMQVHIAVGRYAQDADMLADALRQAADDASDVVNRWEDLPDEDDAYIDFDRGRYHARLDGCRVGDYPSQDVAEIALARAMVESGVYPNAWCISDHGNPVPIDEGIRRWHSTGGDALIDLPGVQYQPGDRIRIAGDDWPYAVIADWGPAGVEAHTVGDPTIRVHVTDRDELHPDSD